MTIRSNGGVFGRNPEFQTATIKGDLTLTTALQFVGGARLTSTSVNFIVDKNISVNGLRLGRANGSASETNTVFGFAALSNASYTGTESTAIGWGAMFSANTNAYQNTAVGRSALFGNTSGYENTAVGSSAGAGNTSGRNNVFLGVGAGGITTGSNNTVIGYNATASATTVSNETTIGNSSTTKSRIFGDIVLASGNGIDFSATAGTGTSELFSDYEEGTWTPVVTSATGAFTTVSASGFYTRIGRTVSISLSIVITDAGTAAGNITATLPFAATSINAIASGREIAGTGSGCQGTILSGSSNCIIQRYDGVTIIGTGRTVIVTGTYIS